MSTLILGKDLAMTQVDSSVFFTPGEAAVASYALKQLTTVGSSATLVNGAVTASDAVIVDDVTLLTVGSFYEWGAGGTKAEVIAADPLTNTAILNLAVTVADNGTVKPVTLAAGAVSGLTYNTSTGILSGTPDTLGSTTSLLYEMTDAAGLKAYSTTFDIQVDNPPVPPVFSGVISNNDFVLGNGNQDLDLSVYATGQSSYGLHAGSAALPAGWTFSTSTALFHVQDGVSSQWSGSIDYINSVAPAGTIFSNTFAITLAAAPAELSVAQGGGFDFSFGFGFLQALNSLADNVLLENGDRLLAENGNTIIVE